MRYGVTRDLVLGLEVVLADGRVLDGLTSLRKDNTGYDLRDLFIGAEGTLGVITAASLKLFPLPRTIETAFVAVPGCAAAVDLLARLRAATGDCVTTFEYLPRIAVEFTVQAHPGRDRSARRSRYACLRALRSRRRPATIRDCARSLEDALGARHGRAGSCSMPCSPQSIAQREALWRLRESVPEAQRHEGASIKHDVSVPVAALPAVPAHRRGCGCRAVAPDGAARRVRPRRRRQPALQRERARRRRRPRRISRAAGRPRSTAVHACVQRVPRQHQRRARHRPAQARRSSRATRTRSRSRSCAPIKQALDPNGIMNPGKVLR